MLQLDAMHAIEVEHTGGPEVLTLKEVPTPTINADQLLVKTLAIGVNFIDTYFRSGIYPHQLPYIPGSEGAGIVQEVGTEVSEFAVGDRVAWHQAPNSYAEYVAVPAKGAVHVPEGVPDTQAASALLQGMTAHFLSHSTYPITNGDTAFIHAGAGGVGLLLTQFVKSLGGTVITTVSTPEKAALSRKAGADHVFSYDNNLPEEVHKITNGEGVAVVYDGVGKSTFQTSLQLVRVRGTLASYGQASGPIPPFDLQELNKAGGIYLTRPGIGYYLRDHKELEWRAGDVFQGIKEGTLTVRVGQSFPLANAKDAHQALHDRKTTGSTVLIP